MTLFGLRLARIAGHSMQPKLSSGDYVLFGPFRTLAVNDVVLVQHACYGRIVKMVSDVDRDMIKLKGMSKHSASSTQLGEIRIQDVLGRMIVTARKN